MKEEETLGGTVVRFELDFETEKTVFLGDPVGLQYDYGLPDDDINIFDFVPTSVISADLKFEELTSSSTLEVEQRGVQSVKTEDNEPCEAAVAIEANIPTPHPSELSKWRTFISAVYYHPNILAHADVADLKELFQLLGSDINFESINVMIDLGKTVKDYKPVSYLRPTPQKPPIFNFAHVNDFFIDMEFKVCIVTKYEINDSMKKAVTEMVTFIVEYPEALYLEIYGFILDCLLKFGADSEAVIDAVMRTQTRRRKCQEPASVLILKKANRLGKGKKAFLQKRLLETPKHRYCPVVPIISEPTPVRHLRKRRTGCVDVDGTPDVSVPVFQACSQIQNEKPISINKMENSQTASTNSLVFAVKRKLFVEEDTQNDLKLRMNNVSDTHSTSLTKDCHTTSKPIIGAKKKRFYSRRNSSTIEKPFTCSICPDRSFAYKGNLVLHIKKKHQTSTQQTSKFNKPKRQENVIPAFTCPVCLQGYASKHKCKTHMDRLHPEHWDWDPISNEDAISRLKKTGVVESKKYNGTRIARGVVRRNTRQSILPLSETQYSSPEQEKTSRLCFNSKPENFRNCFSSPKQQLNVRISNGVSKPYNKLPYSSLSPVKTRQEFRAAVK